MIINTFSYLWSAPAIDAIEELIENGYQKFEIPISSPHCWPDEMSSAERAAMLATLRRNGAEVRSLNVGGYDINLASPGANMRRKSIEHIHTVMNLAEEWNVTEVVISPGTRRPMISPQLESVYGWMYESLETLLPMAKKAGVRLLLENTPYCFAPTIKELDAIVKTAGDPSLMLVYDVANAAYIKEDPVAGVLEHAESIALVHLSDTRTETWGHDPIGTGVVDFRGLGDAIQRTMGAANVVLEIIREEDTLHEFATAIHDLRRAGWNI